MDSITSACGPGGQFRLLVDLRGVSSANADVRAMRVAFNVLQKGFPERVAHLWLAEPPAVFAGLWRLISPLVAPSTRAKINFCAGADVGKVVGRHVDAALLPPDWGGTTPLRPLTAGPPPWAPPDGAARPRKY